MITNEELSAIVDNYCRQIRKICDEAIYAKNDEVIEKVTKIRKIAARINEIKNIQKSAKDNRREMMEKLRIKSWILLDMQVQSPTQKDGRTNKGRRTNEGG